jgi:hypothetical protein
MATSNTESFSVSVTGEVSGEKYPGMFKTKLRLSHREQLRLDEIRRELLGKNHEAATPRAQSQANAFATIMVHLVESPKWWKDSDGGLDLEDDNILEEVYTKIIELKKSASSKLKTEADAAKAELAKAEVK